ncbi:hypothetical protein C6376_41385 [Streptomyces sp. P3]|nr:hypothetical protein C6376_41385 [Streptomyces sp. P3]
MPLLRQVADPPAPRSAGGQPQGNPEGEDVRAAAIGQLSVVYFANRTVRHLSVLEIVCIG